MSASTRKAVTSHGEPACPFCASRGVETVTTWGPSRKAIDDGCSEPLWGVLCRECETIVGRK